MFFKRLTVFSIRVTNRNTSFRRLARPKNARRGDKIAAFESSRRLLPPSERPAKTPRHGDEKLLARRIRSCLPVDRLLT
ncbi:hypothetical protein CR492_05230 [Methylocella silvestris]|uniref:Uncharacterized protein n=1 Tax=Methylocella silvestris TaxID=199596 RepID=A0A2J7TK06_METSI|nr:hypothetical protein CR492_05230 [Methylocella silvestris]